MESSVSEIPELELALLRRGIDERTDACERCDRCRRTLLVGEHVHVYEPGRTVCDLCRGSERTAPSTVRLVHGPAFGHTIRIIDQRAAA
jgi:hypothetical protein